MKHQLSYIVRIFVGNILIAFAVSSLILENHIIAGGVSGIAISINHYFGVGISLCAGIINVSLFMLGLFFLGKTFVMSSLVSTFLFPILLEFFETQPVFHHFLNDPFLASLIAGCFIGIGIGMILKADASTGGIDILALIINKKFNVPVHIVLNIMDLSILLLQFTFNDTTHVIYGIVIVLVTTFMLNKTLTTGTSLMQLVVMSDHYQEIRNMILHDNDAGVTLLASEKGYTEEKSQLILSVLPYRKLPHIKEQILQIDPFAFIIVSHVEEVGGRGFTLGRNS